MIKGQSYIKYKKIRSETDLKVTLKGWNATTDQIFAGE